MTTEARDAAIREAKLHVREIVRNDWLFHPSTDSGLPASSSPAPPSHEVAEWRLREYDSSGSELEPVSSPDLEPEDPYDHDHDLEYKQGLGRAALRAISPRRKRRRQEEEEEMRWNEGLRTWVERRDAWSGAQSRTEIRRREQEGQGNGEEGAAQSQSQSNATANADAQTLDSMTSSGSGTSSSSGYDDLAVRAGATFSIADQDPTSSTTMAAATQQQFPADREREDEPSTADPENPHDPDAAPTTAVAEPSTATPAPATQAATATASSQLARNNYEDPFIPVAPSLISTSNPIRAAITPTMYPSIYSKVVVQGLTPTVPINLADVTKAMVQGWKSDGQWPPKPANTNIVLQDDATVRRPEKPASSAAGAGDAAEKQLGSSPESKRRSGIASTVRKVLHFSGFHQHPFHRRGSSHNQQGQQDQNEGAAEGSGIADQTIPER